MSVVDQSMLLLLSQTDRCGRGDTTHSVNLEMETKIQVLVLLKLEWTLIGLKYLLVGAAR